MLANRFSPQAGSLLMTYTNYLNGKGIDPVNDPGVAIGAQAAAAVILKRSTDGSFPMPPPIDNGGTEPGQWRPTESFLPGPPSSFSPLGVPWFATITPFTLDSPTQYRPAKSPKLTSGEYTNDYNEVKRLGRDVQQRAEPGADRPRDLLGAQLRHAMEQGISRHLGRARARHRGQRPASRAGEHGDG